MAHARRSAGQQRRACGEASAPILWMAMICVGCIGIALRGLHLTPVGDLAWGWMALPFVLVVVTLPLFGRCALRSCSHALVATAISLPLVAFLAMALAQAGHWIDVRFVRGSSHPVGRCTTLQRVSYVGLPQCMGAVLSVVGPNCLCLGGGLRRHMHSPHKHMRQDRNDVRRCFWGWHPAAGTAPHRIACHRSVV